MVKDSSLAVSAELAACSIARFFGFGGAGEAAVRRRWGACGGRSGALGRGLAGLVVAAFLMVGNAFAANDYLDVTDLGASSSSGTGWIYFGSSSSSDGIAHPARTLIINSTTFKDTLIGTNTYLGISVTANVTIYIKNLILERADQGKVFRIEPLGTGPNDGYGRHVKLVLIGRNEIGSIGVGQAGINVPRNSILTIDAIDDGSLLARGSGRSAYSHIGAGAGIGGGYGIKTSDENNPESCGMVTINGGNIEARGGGATIHPINYPQGGPAPGIGGMGPTGNWSGNSVSSTASTAGNGCHLTINGGTIKTLSDCNHGIGPGCGTSTTATATNTSGTTGASGTTIINGGSINSTIFTPTSQTRPRTMTVEYAGTFGTTSCPAAGATALPTTGTTNITTATTSYYYCSSATCANTITFTYSGTNNITSTLAQAGFPTGSPHLTQNSCYKVTTTDGQSISTIRNNSGTEVKTKYTVKLGENYSPANTDVLGCTVGEKICRDEVPDASNSSFGGKNIKTDANGQIYLWLASAPNSTSDYFYAFVGKETKYEIRKDGPNATSFIYQGNGPVYTSDANVSAHIKEDNQNRYAVGYPIYIKPGTYARRDGGSENFAGNKYRFKREQIGIVGAPTCAGGISDGYWAPTENGVTVTNPESGFAYNAIYYPTPEDFGCNLYVAIIPPGGKDVISKDKDGNDILVESDAIWSPIGQVGVKVTIEPEVVADPGLGFITNNTARFKWNEGETEYISKVIYDLTKPFTLLSNVQPSGVNYKYEWHLRVKNWTKKNYIEERELPWHWVENPLYEDIAPLPANPSPADLAAQLSASKKYNYTLGKAGELNFLVLVKDGEPPKISASTKGSVSRSAALETQNRTPTIEGSVSVYFSEILEGAPSQISGIITMTDESDKTPPELGGPHKYASNSTCVREDVRCNSPTQGEEGYCDGFLSVKTEMVDGVPTVVDANTVTKITCDYETLDDNSIYRLTFEGFKDNSSSGNELDERSLNTVYIATPGRGSLVDPVYYVGISGTEADLSKYFTINKAGTDIATNPNISVKTKYSPSNSGDLTKIEYFWEIEAEKPSGCYSIAEFEAVSSRTTWSPPPLGEAEIPGDPGEAEITVETNGSYRINKIFKPEEFGKYIRLVMRPVGNDETNAEGLVNCTDPKKVGVMLYATTPKSLSDKPDADFANTEIRVEGPNRLPRFSEEKSGYIIYGPITINTIGPDLTPYDLPSYRWGYDAPAAGTDDSPATNKRCYDRSAGYCGIDGSRFTPPDTNTLIPKIEPKGPIYITSLFSDATPVNITEVYIEGQNITTIDASGIKGAPTLSDGVTPNPGIVIHFSKCITELPPSLSENTVQFKIGSTLSEVLGAGTRSCEPDIDGKPSYTYTIPHTSYADKLQLGGKIHSIEINNFYDASGVNRSVAGTGYTFKSYEPPTISITTSQNPASIGRKVDYTGSDFNYVANDGLPLNPSGEGKPKATFAYQWYSKDDPYNNATVWEPIAEATQAFYEPKPEDFLRWITLVVTVSSETLPVSAQNTPMQVGVILKSGTVTFPTNYPLNQSNAFISINGNTNKGSLERDGLRIFNSITSLTATGYQGSFQMKSNDWANCSQTSIICTDFYPTSAQLNAAYDLVPREELEDGTIVYERPGFILLNASMIEANPPVVNKVILKKLLKGGSIDTTYTNGSASIDPKTGIDVEFDIAVATTNEIDNAKVTLTPAGGTASTLTGVVDTENPNVYKIGALNLDYDKTYTIAVTQFFGANNGVKQVGTHYFNFTTKSKPKIANVAIVPKGSLSKPAIGNGVDINVNYSEMDGDVSNIQTICESTICDYKWYTSITEGGSYSETTLVTGNDGVMGADLYGKWVKVEVTPVSAYSADIKGTPVLSSPRQVGVKVVLNKVFDEADAAKEGITEAYINNFKTTDVIVAKSNLSVSGQKTDKVAWTTDKGTFSPANGIGTDVEYTPVAPEGDITINVTFTDGVIPFATLANAEFPEGTNGDITISFNKPVLPVRGGKIILKAEGITDIPIELSAPTGAANRQFVQNITGLESGKLLYTVELEAGSFTDGKDNFVEQREIGSFNTTGLTYSFSVTPNANRFNSQPYKYTELESGIIKIANTGSINTTINITGITTCPSNFSCKLINADGTDASSIPIGRLDTARVLVTVVGGRAPNNYSSGNGKLVVANNYAGTTPLNITADLEFTVRKATITPIVAVVDPVDESISYGNGTTATTYNGKGRKVKVTTLDNSSTFEKIISDDGINNKVDAGTTIVSYKLDGDDNYEEYNGSVAVRIDPINILSSPYGNAIIDALPANLVYNRAPHTPDVTFTGGPSYPLSWTDGEDYNVTYLNNIKAGEASVRVTGKGNYTGTITKGFIIGKATLNRPTIAVKGTYGETYGDVYNSPNTNKIVSGLESSDGYPISATWEFNTNNTLTLTSSIQTARGSLVAPTGVKAKITPAPEGDVSNYELPTDLDVSFGTGLAKRPVGLADFGWKKDDNTGKWLNVRNYNGSAGVGGGIECGKPTSIPGVAASNILPGDRDYVLYSCVGRYDDKEVGQNKYAKMLFSLGDPSLYEAAPAYEIKDQDQYVLVGTIIERPIQIAGLSVNGAYSVADKEYDGTRTAYLTAPFNPAEAQFTSVPGELESGLVSGDVLRVDGTPTPEFLNQYASLSNDISELEYTNEVRMKGIALAGTDAKNYELRFDSFRARINKAKVSRDGKYYIEGVYGDVLGRINITTKIREEGKPTEEVQNVVGKGPDRAIWGSWGWADATLDKIVGKASDCRGIGNCLVDVVFWPSNPNYDTTYVKASVIASARPLEFTASGVDRDYEAGNRNVDLNVVIRNLVKGDELFISGKSTISDPSSGLKPVNLRVEEITLSGGADRLNYIIPIPLTAGLIGAVNVNINKADYCKGTKAGKYSHEVMVSGEKVYCIESVPSPYPDPVEMVYDTLFYPNLASVSLPSGWSWSYPTKAIKAPEGSFSTMNDEIRYAAADTNYNYYYSSLAFNVLQRSKNSNLASMPTIVSPCGADTARVTVAAENEYATIWFDNNQYYESDSRRNVGTFTKTGLRYGYVPRINDIEYTVRAQSYDPVYYTHNKIPHTRLIAFSRVANWLRDKSLSVQLDSSQLVEREFFRERIKNGLDLNKTKWLKYTGEGVPPDVVRTGIVYSVSKGSGDYSLVFYNKDGSEAFASCTESGLYPVAPSWENIVTPTVKAPTLVATPFGSRVVAGGTSLLYNTPNGGKISIYTLKGELVSRMDVMENRTVVKIPATKGMYIVKLEAK